MWSQFNLANVDSLIRYLALIKQRQRIIQLLNADSQELARSRYNRRRAAGVGFLLFDFVVTDDSATNGALGKFLSIWRHHLGINRVVNAFADVLCTTASEDHVETLTVETRWPRKVVLVIDRRADPAVEIGWLFEPWTEVVSVDGRTSTEVN